MKPAELYIDRPGDSVAPTLPWAMTRRGDCETCGEWGGELLDGMCIPCRTRLNPRALLILAAARCIAKAKERRI